MNFESIRMKVSFRQCLCLDIKKSIALMLYRDSIEIDDFIYNLTDYLLGKIK